MNRIQEHVLNAAAKAKDKRVVIDIRNAVVPHICSKVTWYKYLRNERQPTLSAAGEILQILKVWLPDLTLDDLLVIEEIPVKSKVKLV